MTRAPAPARETPSRPLRGSHATARAVAAATLWGIVACSSAGRGTRAPEGRATQMQAEAYVERAIRTSNEGFILFPSVRAERVYDRAELQRIAQDLRPKAAACFVNRAIETLRPVHGPDGPAYEGAPEGQAKIRVRVAPDGRTLRTEILESGFEDPQMERCLQRILEAVHWPPNRQGHVHYVDVVHWVSLGANRLAHTKALRERLRREQAAAAVRAKKCLRGKVRPGRYVLDGTNLVDRDGRTLVGRLEPNDLPEDVAKCIVTALRAIRVPADPESFVRPIPIRVGFAVREDGTVVADDEAWLALVRAEEAARARARRADLEGLDLGGRSPWGASDAAAPQAPDEAGRSAPVEPSAEGAPPPAAAPEPHGAPQQTQPSEGAPRRSGALPLSGLRRRRHAPASPSDAP